MATERKLHETSSCLKVMSRCLLLIRSTSDVLIIAVARDAPNLPTMPSSMCLNLNEGEGNDEHLFGFTSGNPRRKSTPVCDVLSARDWWELVLVQKPRRPAGSLFGSNFEQPTVALFRQLSVKNRIQGSIRLR